MTDKTKNFIVNVFGPVIGIILVILFLGITFLSTAGIVWLICWSLPSIGITAFVFSWKLVVLVYIIAICFGKFSIKN